MGIRSAALGLVGALVVAAPVQASADFLREFSWTRDFAHETARIVRGPAAGDARSTAGPVLASHSPAPSAPQGKPQGWTVREIDRLIVEKSARYGINPDFVRAIVTVESRYDPRARSPKGAMGLLQLMPETASTLGVRDPWDPRENLEGGLRFLAGLLREFRDARAALAAYNAGPEVVRNRWPVPRETAAYVGTVLAHFRRLAGGAGAR